MAVCVMHHAPEERFLERHDPADSEFSDDEFDFEDNSKPGFSSQSFQSIVDSFCVDEILGLEFPVTIADPLQADCPLVACSVGFTKLTGYEMSDIVGHNCRFMTEGVSPSSSDELARSRCSEWLRNVQANPGRDAAPHWLVDKLEPLESCITHGELWSVQTNRKKSGEVFQNFFYIKQIHLCGRPFMVGLQADVLECDDIDVQADVRANVFKSHTENMQSMQNVLASKFWYEAAMRRQL